MSYEIINRILDRMKGNIPERFSKIKIPKLVACEKSRKNLLAVIEFIEGEGADAFSAEEKIETYFLIYDFMNFLGENMTEEERKHFTFRSPANYAILQPLIFGKALLANPDARRDIARGAFLFWKNFPYLVKNAEAKFVHRDLHFRNILSSGNGLSLIDLEFCVFSDPLHELITTLRYHWGEKFGDLLLEKIIEKQSKRSSFSEMFKCLAANSIIHGLTDGDKIKEDDMKRFLDFLKFVGKKDCIKGRSK